MYTEARHFQDTDKSLQPGPRVKRPSSVLLVDDDLFMLGVLEDMLHDSGVQGITKAMGCLAALAALDAMALPPELVMCDLNMPGGDGFQFMEDLGARHFKGAVVLVSGMDLHTMHSATLLARVHGLKVAGSLGKPFSAWALSAVLANVS